MSSDFIEETALPGVFVISRPAFEDPRGFFREVYRASDLDARLGFAFQPVQENHSRSSLAALRGIHVAPWHKLVTVFSGRVQQVVVDFRKESPTFGRHISVELGQGKAGAVFVPAHCGNAFLVLSETADYGYLVTDYWAPGRELGVIYNDPDLAISWQLESPLVSDKDRGNLPAGKQFPELGKAGL